MLVGIYRVIESFQDFLGGAKWISSVHSMKRDCGDDCTCFVVHATGCAQKATKRSPERVPKRGAGATSQTALVLPRLCLKRTLRTTFVLQRVFFEQELASVLHTALEC